MKATIQSWPWPWLIGALGAGLGLFLLANYRATPASQPLPVDLPTASLFADNQPIWADTSDPSTLDIVLFRHQFTLHESLTEATLAIFADTRYEVWLDGAWVGRGPARFSRTRHEYDRQPLGSLAVGKHTLAVLVQWAPNIRRAESTTPHLLAHIQGQSRGQPQVIAPTGNDWKVLRTDAWRTDAALVHTLNLLGPTELIDLRRLPATWMQPDFDDAHWSLAVSQSLTTTIHYTPRSIPLLANVPFTATVIETGRLSPNRRLGQLTSTTPLPYTLPFTVFQPTTITVELLVEPDTGSPAPAAVDGIALTWQAAGATRPDVELATMALLPGQHNLLLPTIPPHGLPFALSAPNATFAALPFAQGNHAGRRLLLAEPSAQPASVGVASIGADGLTMDFDQLPAYAVLDLGRVVHGRLVADVSGPAGAIVDIGWDERLLDGTQRPLPHPGTLHPEWDQVDSWVLDGTARHISTLDARAGRYLLLAVWGEGPVRFTDLHVYEERYPVTQRGWFRSSNPRLDAIWQVGVDTAYPSMQDAYADPWRERGQWWGDAYITDHINQVAFGDTALLQRGLRFLAEGTVDGQVPAFAPNSDGAHLLDYAMLWAQSLQDYWVLTGDQAFVAEIYPTLQAFMRHLQAQRNPTTGLLDLPKAHWSQTALLDWSGNDSRYGQSTALNALYYGTLLDAATLAELLDQDADARNWRQTATEVKTQVNQLLYLPDEARYASSLYAGELITPTSHAQAWPLAFNLPPSEKQPALVQDLLATLRIQPYGMYWVLEGLGNANQIAAAVNLIEERYGRLLDLGATTWWEHWDSNLRYQAALSHSWGGSPTWFLTTRLLGAQRTGPNRWRVQPAFAGVAYAEGAIPLQSGELTVHWKKISCMQQTLQVNAPLTSDGEISLSLQKVRSITLNGAAIWPEQAPGAFKLQQTDDQANIAVTGGDYELEVITACGR